VSNRLTGGSWTAIWRTRALRVIVRRLALAIPLLFVVSALSFLLVSLVPGNAADVIAGNGATPQRLAQLTRQLGLDLPVYTQYWDWLRGALHGNLGSSLVTQQSVGPVLVGTRLAVTLSLIVGAVLLTAIFGIGLGMLSAIRGGILGRALDGIALIGYAMPPFWLGAVLIVIFCVKLNLLPSEGYVTFSQSASGWLQSLVLPVVALAFGAIAVVARYTREAMLESLGSEYIRVAWANGVSACSIYFRHALKNAGPRIITSIGVTTVGLLTGTILVETVFAMPGLGSLAVTATTQRDLPTIQGVVVLFTIIVVIVNLIVDLAYTWLNPKVTSS
jgi:peptide/nickel transport system permease protein